MDVKKEVFAEARRRMCKPRRFWPATPRRSTSMRWPRHRNGPNSLSALHFFAPANIMKLLEIVRGAKTSPQTLTTAMALGKTLRKVAWCRPTRSVSSATGCSSTTRAKRCIWLEEGVPPERIDRVMKDSSAWRWAPFATFDLSGVDVFWHIQQERTAALGEKRTNIIDRMYRAKRWGQKTGWASTSTTAPTNASRFPIRTCWRWLPKRLPRPESQPRTVSDAEIVERLAYALTNVGADLLAREIALRAGR
jgi:3-hydroxyacyl-CoA dehydrogenase